MKKFRVMVALAAVMTLALSATVFAAPSPQAAVTAPAPTILGGLSDAGVPVTVKPITDKATLVTLASNVMAYAQSVGGTPQVVGSADIQAPAGYTGGPITLSLAAPGLVPGDNAYAAHLMANGQTEIVQLTVGNGTATGTYNGLSPVTIFKVVGASASAASSGLHQTGSADYTVFFLALAIISGSVMLYANKRYNRA